MSRRKLLLILWFGLPLAAFGFHRMYGKLLLAHDQAATLFQIAGERLRSNDWNGALSAETRLLDILPDDESHRDDRVRIQIAIQTARSHLQQGVEAVTALTDLVHLSESDVPVSQSVRRDARTELAQLDYYTGWRMRLEGSPRWSSQVELARQQFQYLARTASNPSERDADIQNTEAAIRLERMDLSELRATSMPPPGQGLESQPAEKQQSQNDDDDHADGGPEDKPPGDTSDDHNHGTGGNSGGKYGRPLKGS